jgi:hypothetical protein
MRRPWVDADRVDIFRHPDLFFLIRGKVPSRESMVLSMLFVVALELSFLPVVKRVDQLLATDGAENYEYKLTKGANFEPLLAGPPVLKFPQVKEYWAQYDPGSVHRFVLVHGPLGLWQLDRSALNQQYHAFYEHQNQGK